MAGRVLVTGSTGFIGRYMVKFLIEKGYEVYALYRNESKFKKIFKNYNVVGIKYDLVHEKKDIDTYFDYVFHFSGVIKAIKKEDYLKGNFYATKNLFYSLKGGFGKFILISTQAVEHPKLKCPLSIYGYSKLLAEKFIASLGINYTIFRPPVVFGPEDPETLIMFKWAKNGIIPVMNLKLSIIYVENLIEAIYLVALKGKNKFYYAKDLDMKVRELVEKVLPFFNRKFKIYIPLLPFLRGIIGYVAEGYNRIAGRVVLASLDKMREIGGKIWVCDDYETRLLGWKPKVSLEEALRRTFESYRSLGWI